MEHRPRTEHEQQEVGEPQREYDREREGEQRDESQAEQGWRENRPRIYVASLADYTAGRLHGVWIDANQAPEELARHVARMLNASPEPSVEEYAIHDYQGFGGLHLSEYETLETVAAIARGIDEHGLAFAAWAEHVGTLDQDRLEQFNSAYLGTYPSIEDFAEQYAEDIGLSDDLVPGWARGYVRLDIEALARDLAIDFVVAESRGGGVHVFDPNV